MTAYNGVATDYRRTANYRQTMHHGTYANANRPDYLRAVFDRAFDDL
jgi:hypothetical protein